MEAPAGSRHLTEWNEPPVHDEDKLYDTIEELVAIGDDHGVSAAQVALAYTIGQARGDLGDRRRPDRGAAGRQSRRRRPDASRRTEMERLDKVSAQPLPYPYWHQANTCERSPQPGRSHAAGPPHRGLSHCSCIVLFLASGLIAGVIAWNSSDVLVGRTLRR